MEDDELKTDAMYLEFGLQVNSFRNLSLFGKPMDAKSNNGECLGRVGINA